MTGSRTAPAVEPAVSLLTARELAAIRRPFRGASLLPGRDYHHPVFLDFERERWLREDRLLVAREEDAEASGSFRPLAVQGGSRRGERVG